MTWQTWSREPRQAVDERHHTRGGKPESELVLLLQHLLILQRNDGQLLGRDARGQGLTLVHFSAQPKPFWSHLRVSPCLIDWGKIMHQTYPTNRAYVDLKSGRV